jgi:glycosyltransferase involved in cell wall biosynthesis
MRVTLVAPSYARNTSGLERHVAALGAGLLRHGVQVEVLTPDYEQGARTVSEVDGVIVRRFRVPRGDGRLAAATGLWEHLRRTTGSPRIVHLHGGSIPLTLAVMRAQPARLVFTPHDASERLSRWPYAYLTRAVVARAAQILCTSEAEAELVRSAVPRAAARTRVVPHAADVAAIEAARPFAVEGKVVLAVGRLARCRHVDRAIAAMAGLDPALTLVVVGDGPARRSLQARACDLEVSPQVRFVRRVSDAGLYRWLRTARALVALGDERAFGPELLEAFAAGLPVVASDTAAHREAGARIEGAKMMLVSPDGSPFEVEDAIGEAVRRGPLPPGPATVPSWDSVVERILGLYEGLASGAPLGAQNNAPHQGALRTPDTVAGV